MSGPMKTYGANYTIGLADEVVKRFITFSCVFFRRLSRTAFELLRPITVRLTNVSPGVMSKMASAGNPGVSPNTVFA